MATSHKQYTSYPNLVYGKRINMYRILFGIILTGTLFYVSVLYKSTSMIVLSYAAAVWLLSSCLFLIWRMRTVQCRVAFPIAIAECGKPLTVRIFLQNRSILPCLRFQCQMEQQNHFLHRKKKKWLQGSFAAYGDNSYDYLFVAKDYGSYDVRLRKVRVYDLTGLFYFEKKVDSGGCVQVLPQMREIGVHLSEAVRNFCGDADVYDDFRPGDDHSELFQVRPFSKGDKIQSIHWKLSVKSQDLLVKEDSRPKACPVVFLLDYCSGKQRETERVNAYLVIMSSIALSLMDAGCPHYAAWYSAGSGDIMRVRVDDEESLYVFLSCYLEETFPEQQKDPEEAYREKYRGEPYLCLLHLDEKLRLSKNEQQIAAFALEGWEEQLQGMEIVL